MQLPEYRLARLVPDARVLLTGGAAMIFAISPLLVSAQDDPLLEASRDLSRQFGQQLQAALKDALSEGGPTAAITVCKDIAPQIASELSRLSGAKVSRTSQRYRNPTNAPEPWQKEVLANFQSLPSGAGEAPEYFSRTDGAVRYMQGIRLGSVCLVCHGTSIPDAVQRELGSEYPYDLARGYELGEMRGAFSVTWPHEDGALTRETAADNNPDQ